jgi:hypothetical protein
MAFAPVILWTEGARQCVLRRSDGQYELLLRQKGRVVRLETCDSEETARSKAQEWVWLETLPEH